MRKNIISIAVLTAVMTSFSGCGSSSSSSNNTSKVDIAKYFEKSSQVKNIVNISKDSRVNEETKNFYTDTVVVKDNIITHEIFNQLNTIVDIRENDINITNLARNNSYLVLRNVTIGQEISSYTQSVSVVENGLTIHIKLQETCFLDDKLTSLKIDSNSSDINYEGDIISQVCTTVATEIYPDLNETFNHTDIEYTYFQKDKGRIAVVNQNCMVPHQNTSPDNNATYYEIDDKSEICSFETTTQDLLLE